MQLPDRILSDELLRRLIIGGVLLVLGACIISQVMMQLGGGPRDEHLDFSDQFPEDAPESLDSAVIFPDGMPPFISCAGVFYPEKAVFDIGLSLGGLMFLLFGIEVFLRTESQLKMSDGSNWRRMFNVGQLFAAIVIGASMVLITRYPFNTDLYMHLLYATNIFHGSYIWGAFLVLSRAHLDSELSIKTHSIWRIRWLLVVMGFLSYYLMIAFAVNGNTNTAAFFEWVITFAAEAQLLTMLPAIAILASTQDE